MRFTPTTFLGTAGTIGLIQNGLVFDFRAEDYQSGSLTWNAYVGDYTASITGTVGGGLEDLTSSVGFDGNHWLQFSNNMTASISSSAWEVYALVNLASTSSTTYEPTFFAKGTDAPGWYYSYEGGIGSQSGLGYINYQGGVGLLTDTLNNPSFNNGLRGVFPNIPQQFVFSYPSSSTFPTGPYTLNWYGNTNGNTIIGDIANISPLSFSGSAAANLTFGFGVDGWDNFSGSVVRLYAYNRVLTLQERKNNWFALTNIFVR
jgi:hypothetical protein